MDISSDDSHSSLLDELQEVVEHCQELHRHHEIALSHLHTIQQLLALDTPITIHYQCEDHDFGTLLESLHAKALQDIDQGATNTFGQTLLHVLAYSSFSS